MRGLILSFLTVSGLLAQNYSVTGTVTDEYLLDSLSGIGVSAYHSEGNNLLAMASTDESGSYFLTIEIVSTTPYSPNAFNLSQNYPNPYNPSTVIPLSVAIAGRYTLTAYNVLGQTLAQEVLYLLPGSHQVTYDGASGSAGLHLIELRGADQHAVIKTLLMDRSSGHGFKLNSTAQSTSMAKPSQDLQVRLSFIGDGYVSQDTLITLSEASNSINMSLYQENYSPFVIIESIIDTLPEMWIDPADSMFLATYSIMDPDSGDMHAISLINGSPDDMLLDLNGNRVQLAYANPDFNGVFFYGVIAEDAAGLKDTAMAQVVFTPVNDAPQFAGWINDYTTYDNSVLEIDLTNHFIDVDGDALTRSLIDINGEHYGSQTDDNGIMRLVTNDWFGVMENVRAVATDGEYADTSNAFNIIINPTSISQVYRFVAVYDDTLLSGGISTLKFRKMDATGTEYEWLSDSISTSTNGIINLTVEPGVYSVRGYHTDEYQFITPLSIFYDTERNRIGQSSAMRVHIDGDPFDDYPVMDTVNAMDLNPMTNESLPDTVIVYKMMQDFPWSHQPGELKTYLDQHNQGLRGFSDEVIRNLPFLGRLDGVPPSIEQQEWTQELIDTLASLPQINFNGYYYESETIPDNPHFSLGFDENNQYASNLAIVNWNTNQVTAAGANYQPQVNVIAFKQEIMEAIMDVDDFGGNSPYFVYPSGNLTPFGKQAFVITYLVRRGTFLY